MRAEAEATERQQYLSFVVGGRDCAVSILKVREILQYETLTPVPGTPRSVRGVLNLRGSVVPVVDLGVKFGLGESPPTRWTCVLVVETAIHGEAAIMGVVADSVNEVVEVAAADVEAPPAFGAGVELDWLVGMARLGGKGFALVLDLDRVLAADERTLAAALPASREGPPAGGSRREGAVAPGPPGPPDPAPGPPPGDSP